MLDMTPTTYRTNISGNVAVISCSGPITFGLQSTELHVRVKELLSEGHRVVLDLSEVPAMDSSGIGTLFAIYTSTLNSDSKLALAGLTPHVREVLTLTKALSLIASYPQVADAIKAMA